jgi:PII-like signaling protein
MSLQREEATHGAFESREKAALVYEIVLEKLRQNSVHGAFDVKGAEGVFNSARNAACEADRAVPTKTRVKMRRLKP